MDEEPTELIEFLQPYPLEVQQTALKARLVLLEMFAPVSEAFFDATSAVCSDLMYTEIQGTAL